MSLTITQRPASASLAQSPMIFTLSESTAVVASASFQYYADLYYWTGSLSNSGSSQYTLVKYPNNSGVGIFDVSKIVNSTLTELRQQNSSNVKYYKIDGYYRYYDGTYYRTGSHVTSGVYKALDGYGLFQQPIGQPINSSSIYWPMMTDGPDTQSLTYSTDEYDLVNVSQSDAWYMGVYVGDAGAALKPNRLVYRCYICDLADPYSQDCNYTGSAYLVLSGSVSSSEQIQQAPMGVLPFLDTSLVPLDPIGMYGSFGATYTVQPFYNTTPLGEIITFKSTCAQKYPSIRIKWKNRFGQFDFFNFYMVSKETFKTTKRTYMPQIGTWDAPTLSYNNYDSQNLNYLADSYQEILVNTFWIPQNYNDIFKQLLVSDEIYIVQKVGLANFGGDEEELLPITINTDTVTFKTNVVDGLIQYGFNFRYGQGYKLII
jgi:hypothetical protein